MPTMTSDTTPPERFTLGQAMQALGQFLDRGPDQPKLTHEELDLAESVLIRIQEIRIRNLERKFANDPQKRDQLISELISNFVRDLYPEPAP